LSDVLKLIKAMEIVNMTQNLGIALLPDFRLKQEEELLSCPQ
jgi:hypothetical protein